MSDTGPAAPGQSEEHDMNLKTMTAGGLLILALGACATAASPAAAPSHTPNPTTKWNEDEWSVTTPKGWKRQDITPRADASKAIRYLADDGRYVIIAIDPIGSGYDYDELWTYEPLGDGFQIVDRTQGDPDDDGRFDGYVLWETGTSPKKVGGHVWTFQFGDVDSTQIDAASFEAILESVTVH